MAHHDGGPLEVQQGLFEGVASPQVQMIGRFVEHEHVDPLHHKAGQGSPAALAAAQFCDRLIDLVAGQTKAAKQIAHALFRGVGIPFGPNGADDRFVLRQGLQMLIVIAELDQMPALHRAGVRPLVAQEDAEQGGLAAAVGSQDAEPLAALKLEAEMREQRTIVRLGEVVHLQHHIARAPDFAEVHVRHVNRGRLLHAFQLVERLLPRLGLFVQLPVMHAADVVLLFGDVFALRFPCLELLLVALLPQPGISPVVSGIGRDPPGVQLEDLVHDAVEEIAWLRAALPDTLPASAWRRCPGGCSVRRAASRPARTGAAWPASAGSAGRR